MLTHTWAGYPDSVDDEPRTKRRRWRERLYAQRRSVDAATKRSVEAAVAEHIRAAVPDLERRTIGFYWPMRGELVLTGFVAELVRAGARAALPVVVERNAPLEFHSWAPGDALVPGVWNIPIPAEARRVEPDLLLVPLLGYDGAGYRLGNGGGYYDRTLAVLHPRPATIGVGYADSALQSIEPRAHDIPMDAIVTERGVTVHGSLAKADADAERERFASPVCYGSEWER